MGQLVKPDQLDGLVAYLLSPESGVMTGALVDYDQHVAGALLTRVIGLNKRGQLQDRARRISPKRSVIAMG